MKLESALTAQAPGQSKMIGNLWAKWHWADESERIAAHISSNSSCNTPYSANSGERGLRALPRWFVVRHQSPHDSWRPSLSEHEIFNLPYNGSECMSCAGRAEQQ